MSSSKTACHTTNPSHVRVLLVLCRASTTSFLQVIKERLQQRGGLQPFHNAVLRLSCTDETSVVPAMSRVASGFLNKVTLGSYPVSLCASSCPRSTSTHVDRAAMHRAAESGADADVI